MLASLGALSNHLRQIHAPNENIRIDLYLKHARHMARIINEFAR